MWPPGRLLSHQQYIFTLVTSLVYWIYYLLAMFSFIIVFIVVIWYYCYLSWWCIWHWLPAYDYDLCRRIFIDYQDGVIRLILEIYWLSLLIGGFYRNEIDNHSIDLQNNFHLLLKADHIIMMVIAFTTFDEPVVWLFEACYSLSLRWLFARAKIEADILV